VLSWATGVVSGVPPAPLVLVDPRFEAAGRRRGDFVVAPRPCRAELGALDLPRRSAYQPEDEEKHDSADEGDENRPTHSTHGSRDAEDAEQPASDESTDDPDNDVTDDTVAGATHDE